MKLVLVVAVSENGVIGRDGGLPWRLPAELSHFKATTMGHHVIVGRRTFESIRRPLPGRTMIVVTSRELDAPGWIVARDLPQALAIAEAAGDDEAHVAGGAALYRAALPIADRIVLTRVHAQVDGDTTFPELARGQWVERRRWTHPADPANAHAFTVFVLDRAAAS